MKNNKQKINNKGDILMTEFTSFDMLNENSIKKFQSLTKGQPEVLQEIMSSFIEESSILINEMENSINNSQMEKFRVDVHTFKGLLATIGATKLFEIAKYIDQNNKQENFDVARQYFPLLKSTYLELEKIVKKKFF